MSSAGISDEILPLMANITLLQRQILSAAISDEILPLMANITLLQRQILSAAISDEILPLMANIKICETTLEGRQIFLSYKVKMRTRFR